MSKKIAEVSKNCVACGSCVKECPLGAISIYKGMYADVDKEKCVGCGKCSTICPAGVITIKLREEEFINA
ncbi:4Fe-4S dicluster domain-containing protein [Peptostreptococcus faecalis]|uniref:4Fe-4S dicluster domain-containing protein n=1 Tax=Peptostreptococcus faecalis TaxID=2045015 RepID=UPI000C7B7B1F|nr:4Fe-4S dicluster domain-containing protein [Peptostreptococcus faecalis]